MNSDARARKLRAVAWSSVLVRSGIILWRFRASLVFGFTTRRSRNLIRFRARDRMAGRRAGLANAVEHRTRRLTFSFSWRTPSDHVQPPLSCWITRDASASRNRLSTLSRADLNNPPTAVGGIARCGDCDFRNDLNIPPTPVGGIEYEFHQRQLVVSSDPFYNTPYPRIFQSHQRQLVVSSDPFYNTPTLQCSNPTNGSWWFLQIPPTTHPTLEYSNPTNGSWWFLQILSTTHPTLEYSNPTNGSWWFLQILSTTHPTLEYSNPTNGSWWFLQ